jgi:hypothetical protein
MLRKVIQSVAGGAYLRTVFVGLYATQGGKNVRVPRLRTPMIADPWGRGFC